MQTPQPSKLKLQKETERKRSVINRQKRMRSKATVSIIEQKLLHINKNMFLIRNLIFPEQNVLQSLLLLRLWPKKFYRAVIQKIFWYFVKML